jgi:transposase-like protein
MTSPKVIDWEGVRVHYRSSRLAIKEIARRYGISDAGIIKHARRHGWERDLGTKVSAATQFALARKTVPDDVVVHSDEQIVEANAEANVVIIESQRGKIKQAMDVCAELMLQLQQVVSHRVEIQDLVRADAGKDKSHGHLQRRQAMMKALSLPTNASTLKDLTVAAKNLIELQRQAHNLDATTSEGSIEDLLAQLRDDDQSVPNRGSG